VLEDEGSSILTEKARRLALEYSRKGFKGVLLVINDGEEYFLFETYEEALSKLRDLYSKGKVRNSILKEIPSKKRFIEVV